MADSSPTHGSSGVTHASDPSVIRHPSVAEIESGNVVVLENLAGSPEAEVLSVNQRKGRALIDIEGEETARVHATFFNSVSRPDSAE